MLWRTRRGVDGAWKKVRTTQNSSCIAPSVTDLAAWCWFGQRPRTPAIMLGV